MKRRMKSALTRCRVLVEESWRTVREDAWKAFLIGLLAIPVAVAVLVCFGVGIIVAVVILIILVAVGGLVCLVLVIVAAIVSTSLVLAPLYYALSVLGKYLTRQKHL